MTSEEKMRDKFILVVDELRAKKKIKNDSELAEKLMLTPHSLYKVKKGTMRLTLNIITGLYDSFKINPAYFYDDRVPMYMGEKPYKFDAEGDRVISIDDEKAPYGGCQAMTLRGDLNNAMSKLDLELRTIRELLLKRD